MRRLASSIAVLALPLVSAAIVGACSQTPEWAPECVGYACTPTDAAPAPEDAGVPDSAEARKSKAEQLFLALYPEIAAATACGQCHAANSFNLQENQLFLAGDNGEEAYQSVTKHPGVLVEDPALSVLFTKGQHVGSPLEAYPELAPKVVEWLRWEALALQAVVAPSSPPLEIKAGTNTLDLDALTDRPEAKGVSLKFSASFSGGFLLMKDTRVVVSGPNPVQLVQPKLFLVKPDGSEALDPSDTFGAVDQTFPAQSETLLAPATALFVGTEWNPWVAGSKLRVEAKALTPGENADAEAPAACKDVARFTAEVVPVLTGGGVGAPLSCRAANCHGNVQKSPDMSTQYTDDELCLQIRGFLDFDTPANSRILRPSVQGHAGGLVASPANYRSFWTDRIAADEIF